MMSLQRCSRHYKRTSKIADNLRYKRSATTASVYECKLLTMDLDFGHLRDEFVDVVYITPSTFTS